jgi:methylmalonyl-CoA/ethylmalonyl-CoA epimerase
MRYKWLDHLAVAVKSREEATATYRNVLGMQLEWEGQSDGTGIYQAFFHMEDGHFLALIEPMVPDNAVGRAVATRGEGFYVVSLAIDSKVDAVKELEANGVRLLNANTTTGPAFVHPRSANGMLIQLAERTGDHMPARDSNVSPEADVIDYKWIDHMVLAVNDVEQATATYRDNLGMTFDRMAESEALGLKQAYFRMDNGRHLELAEPVADPNNPVRRALERRGEGVYLVALAVSDMAKAVESLKARGAQVIGDGAQGGQVFIHPRSTHGVLYQLVQRD